MALPSHLMLVCPDCGRRVRRTTLQRTTTLVVDRRCYCGTAWSVRIVPLRMVMDGRGIAHELVWTRRSTHGGKQ